MGTTHSDTVSFLVIKPKPQETLSALSGKNAFNHKEHKENTKHTRNLSVLSENPCALSGKNRPDNIKP